MKLTVLEKALSAYKVSGNWSEQDLIDLTQAENELSMMRNAAPDEDYCTEVYTIPTTLMIDFGNRMWYDTYGRMARRLPNGKEIPFNFINAIKQDNYVCELAPHILEDIHGFLHDLWHENEATGENRSDGSYCKYLTDADFEQIQDILCDKLDEVEQGEQYEAIMQAKRRLDAMYHDKWTNYCGTETCDGCDGSACRPC